MAAGFAVAGAEVNDLVRRPNDTGFVLDHDHRVSQVAQSLQNFDQSTRVTEVQADARFIEHVERVDQTRANARGQIHAFGFATGQRACRTIQREIAEADFDEVTESRADFMQNQADGIGGFGAMCCGNLFDEPQGIADGQLVEIGEGDLRLAIYV